MFLHDLTHGLQECDLAYVESIQCGKTSADALPGLGVNIVQHMAFDISPKVPT
jgi:hypothetical protein